MVKKIRNAFNLLRNMGLRYTAYRVRHEVERRSGILKRRFAQAPPHVQFLTRRQWMETRGDFFFTDRESITVPRNADPALRTAFERYQEGYLSFFNSTEFYLGRDYDWVTNPDTGYRYPATAHWTQIADYSTTAGDIKYVWEKSRFSFLYDIIRYDYHHDVDCAAVVFREILSWIDKNPVNAGPNYRCSQEISLRVMNWTFALYYYKNSPQLTDAVFDKIQYALYWQLDHVYRHIDFSRIAVRNNHAITETLMLYLAGLLYPGMKDAQMWKARGKKWFEAEIAYQVYADGTFLQFSMNYHRVVAQLLTWAITLAHRNGERFSPVVYERAGATLKFLRTCMDDYTGWLPNYGANDGALFFRLSGAHYRDYRPQLQALGACLGQDLQFTAAGEDAAWYGYDAVQTMTPWRPASGMHAFDVGGYYVLRETDTLTFIRCGRHKDRPSQADNLHMDVWHRGINVLADAGSYKYNTDADTLRYFMGTASHNTVMLDDYDQMQKGARFIWYNWSQSTSAAWQEDEDYYIFRGEIAAFAHVGYNILHAREIKKCKNAARWIVRDTVYNAPEGIRVKQMWHRPESLLAITWDSEDEKAEKHTYTAQKGYISELYGAKRPADWICFTTTCNALVTTIDVKPEALL